MIFKNSLPVIAFILLTACHSTQNSSVNTSLDATTFSKKIHQTDDAQIVDVRTPDEFKTGHLPNAININKQSADFMDQIAMLDKSKPVFTYCMSGGRSAAAAKMMRNSGFSEVYEMDGGLLKWRAAHLPESTDANSQRENATVGMSRAQYDALVNSHKLVLVDFYADWCGPCKMMEPSLARISKDLQDELSIVRINVDENRDLSMELNISSIPNFKLYKNKELVWNHVGYIEEKALRRKLK